MIQGGGLSLVLHAHLPFVRHPEHPRFLEEAWLFEAILQVYAPLLERLERLVAEVRVAEGKGGLGFTICLSPPLCEMLADPLLLERGRRYADRLLAFAHARDQSLRRSPLAPAAAQFVVELERSRRYWVETCGLRLLPRFRALAASGQVALFTCSATHAILPLLATDEGRNAQLGAAVANFEHHLGMKPAGIWLPECAWTPGLDRHLMAWNLPITVLEGRALTDVGAQLGTGRPTRTPAGLTTFGRDGECSTQVWSSRAGYPADPFYHEFYRDEGWDAPLEMLEGLLDPPGVRRSVGMGLYRITGTGGIGEKEPYHPGEAQGRVHTHAAHFVEGRLAQLNAIADRVGWPGFLCAPFDAELFGNWWSEGPDFLAAVVREAKRQGLPLRTLPAAASAALPVQVLTPARSTWGRDGDFSVWLNSANQAYWPRLHAAEERMVRLVQREDLSLSHKAALGRELLLAQSSDWPFILTMQTSVGYAKRRLDEHLGRFEALATAFEHSQYPAQLLTESRFQSTIFPELDPMLWHPQHCRARGGAATVSAVVGAAGKT